jgi:CBS domain containing-hemolysin-like protein
MYSLLILFFVLAIAISFLCSLWEAVLLSVTPSYAQVKLKEGHPLGRHLQAFKEDIDRPLAAILTLNTIAHTVGAIGVGDQAAKIWSDANALITGLLIPATMTLAILILSELIPKTLGATYWQRLAPFTVRSLKVVITLLWPLVWFSQLLTRALKHDESMTVFSRSDFVAMAEIGADQGVFEQQESRFIYNLLHLGNVRAADCMTPRTVVAAADETLSLSAFVAAHPDLRFSRIPCHESGNKDHVTGYFLKSEALTRVVSQQGETPIETIRKDILVVSEGTSIQDVFNRFLEKREHIALVVDEFGGMAGVVTMEDVFETLLGIEILDESDRAADMRALARKNWETRARRKGLLVSPNIESEPSLPRGAKREGDTSPIRSAGDGRGESDA